MKQERREVLTQKVRNWMRTHDSLNPFTFSDLTEAFGLHALKAEQNEVGKILDELSNIDNDTVFEDIHGEKCKITVINKGKEFSRCIRKGNTIWQFRDVCQYLAIPVGCTFNPTKTSTPKVVTIDGLQYTLAA